MPPRPRQATSQHPSFCHISRAHQIAKLPCKHTQTRARTRDFLVLFALSPLFLSGPADRYNFQSVNGKLNIQAVSNICCGGSVCGCVSGCSGELQIPMLTIRFGACFASIRVFELPFRPLFGSLPLIRLFYSLCMFVIVRSGHGWAM